MLLLCHHTSIHTRAPEGNGKRKDFHRFGDTRTSPGAGATRHSVRVPVFATTDRAADLMEFSISVIGTTRDQRNQRMRRAFAAGCVAVQQNDHHRVSRRNFFRLTRGGCLYLPRTCPPKRVLCCNRASFSKCYGILHTPLSLVKWMDGSE